MTRFVPPLVLALALAACQDTRRDAVRTYLESHPPENFTTAEIPEKILVTAANESVLHVKYKLAAPTVKEFDLLAQPRAAAPLERINAVRGWALASLPAGDPTREQISSLTAEARAPFPVKRIVTPAGAVIDTLVILKLTKASTGWQVAAETLDAHVPGEFDKHPDTPSENSPQASAKLASLATLAAKLEDMRKNYLEARRLAAERSLAVLRSRMQTGETYEGDLPGAARMRLVVTRGFDAGDPVAVVVSVQRAMQSSVRFTGGIVQQPDGQSAWRAAQTTPLSARGFDPLIDSSLHPILTLSPLQKGLIVQIKTASQPARTVILDSVGKADLIPEPDLQPASHQ